MTRKQIRSTPSTALRSSLDHAEPMTDKLTQKETRPTLKELVHELYHGSIAHQQLALLRLTNRQLDGAVLPDHVLARMERVSERERNRPRKYRY